MSDRLHVVTGAFGYSGRYIATELIARGERVRTLSNSAARGNPFGDGIEIHQLDFSRPDLIVESLRGADVLYNTYWVRYDFKDESSDFGYEAAVTNTRVLFECARAAGVARIVHLSVANASEESSWGYFRGKARLEQDLAASGLAHAIVRPTIIFGRPENVLINNIAWMLRRFPVHGVFGTGKARVTPIHVDDLARICADAGNRTADEVLNAVGPETLTYKQMVEMMAAAMGLRRLILPMADFMILGAAKVLGKLLDDIVITRHEIAGLRDETMYTGTAALGVTRFTEWVQSEAATLGRDYVNDLARRRRS